MPDEWRTVTVKQLVEEKILDRPMDGNHGEIHPKGADFVESGIPFIMASDLSNGRVDTVHCAFIREEQARKLRKGFSMPGDVLISHKATMGRTALVQPSQFPFLMLTPQVTYYRVLDAAKMNSRYLKYYFDSPPFQQLFDTWGQKGSTRSYLGITSQLDLPIALPPPDQQKAIACILGALDDKIELNRMRNRSLEAMARAIFQSWFVDFEPVKARAAGLLPPGLSPALAALFPDSFSDSPLGPIPTGWRVGSVLDVADLLSGGTPKTSEPNYWDGDIPWASAKDVSQCGESFLIDTERKITQEGLQNSATQIIPAFSSVVVARGATTGRMTMFGHDIAMNQTCYALKSKFDAPRYLYLMLRHEIDAIVHTAHGSVFDTITTATFRASKVHIAAEEIAQAFDVRISPIFGQILGNLQQSRTLAALRNALLPKLISGELPVPDAEQIVGRAV